MRLSWSKAISLPSQPIFIPPELADVTIPPPLLDLPFNAQMNDSKKVDRSNRKLNHQLDSVVNNTKLLRSRSSSSSSSSASSSSTSSQSSDSSSQSSKDSYSSKNKNKKREKRRVKT